MEIKENIRIMTLPASLISCVPGYYSNNVIEARAALTMISDASEYVNRMRMNWADMRGIVLENFPQAPLLRQNTDEYLKHVDDIYLTDAYHSLSIEGYRVSEELIERVRAGNWDPETNHKDKEYADALAARGYWQAFQAVKKSLEKIMNKNSPGTVVSKDHSMWYRELFAPSVNAGLIAPSDLAGYRNQPVYIRKSRHIPPPIRSCAGSYACILFSFKR